MQDDGSQATDIGETCSRARCCSMKASSMARTAKSIRCGPKSSTSRPRHQEMPNEASSWARGVPAQLHQADQGTLVRRELASAVTLAVDDEYGDSLDQGVRQIECGRRRNQRVSCARGLRPRTPPPTAREPRTSRGSIPSPDQWPHGKTSMVSESWLGTSLALSRLRVSDT